MGNKAKKDEQGEKKEIKIDEVGSVRILLSFIKNRILGIPDPIYEKVVLLKKVRKKLKKINIKGIQFSKNRLTADFGKFLYQIYRYFYPLKSVIELGKPSNKNSFLLYLIQDVCNDKQSENLDLLLSEKHVQELFNNSDSKKANKQIKDLYKEFSRSFSKVQSKKVNHLFSMGESLFNFLKFDLYVLIRKFSPDMKEDNVYGSPNFRDVSAGQVESMLKDFADFIYFLNTDADYYEFIKVYGKFLGRDIIPPEDFQKFFSLLHNLIKTNYLVLMVQYISKDVFFRPYYSYSEKNAFAQFLKNLVESVNKLQSKTNDQIRNQTINKILVELFNTSDFFELTAYTYEQNEYLKKHGMSKFIYIEAFNSLKKFMLDKYNKNLRKSIHVFILKASFTTVEFSESLNTLYYETNTIIEKILNIEGKLKGEDGWSKIQNLLRGKATDSSLGYLAKKNIDEFNSDIKKIILDSLNILNILKTKLKIVVDAYNKNLSEPIANIKKFAGNNTVEVIKHLANGFNDISKILVYFKIIFKPQ